MRRLAIVLALTACLGSLSALAANTQQEKMKSCNAQAREQNLSGDARQTFMKTCLSAKPAAPAAKPLTVQQEKMKKCSTDAKAKGLKGAERKTFMSTCLK